MANLNFQEKMNEARRVLLDLFTLSDCGRCGTSSSEEFDRLKVAVGALRGGLIHRAPTASAAVQWCGSLLLAVLRVMVSGRGVTGVPRLDLVKSMLEEVCNLLARKNASYGNTALEPVGIFARGSALDLIDVRIDDKLSRLLSQGEDFGEDTLMDLAGYLVLRIIVLQSGGFVAPEDGGTEGSEGREGNSGRAG